MRKRLPLVADSLCNMPVNLYLPYFFKVSQFMGTMLIERNETSIEASSSDITVAKHAVISWTLDYVICVWCFNKDINY